MIESNDDLEQLRKQLEALYLRMRAGEDCNKEVLEISTKIDQLINSLTHYKKLLQQEYKNPHA